MPLRGSQTPLTSPQGEKSKVLCSLALTKPLENGNFVGVVSQLEAFCISRSGTSYFLANGDLVGEITA